MGYTRRNLLTAGLAVSASSLIANAPLPLVEIAAAKKEREVVASWRVSANMEFPEKPAFAAVAERQQIRNLYALGRLLGSRRGQERYLVHQQGLLAARFSERKHHEQTYGPLEKFGYKDFIAKFTGEKFDPDEWAELFQKAGARFAGPVAEHHDGFSMWNTKFSEWNAAKMGPKRDIVGELSRSIKHRGMRFVTAFHHAENWFFFPTTDMRYDSSDPRYSGLYGPIHEPYALPTREFLDRWQGKIVEVIDNYDPDLIWFDFGLELVHETYKQDVLAYFYNKAAQRKKEVVVTYKKHNLVPLVGILDLD